MVLDYTREQFARVNTKLDRMSGEVTNPKMRVWGLEAEAGHVPVGLAGGNNRLDRFDARSERLEQRPEWADALPA